jgi:hypothetical protein
MAAAWYQEQALEGALPGFYEGVKEERGCIDFQQDGAPSHTAKTTIAWFKKASIPLAEHPAQSPDINPIKPVWHELKKVLCSQQHASTVEGLKSVICTAWDFLPLIQPYLLCTIYTTKEPLFHYNCSYGRGIL